MKDNKEIIFTFIAFIIIVIFLGILACSNSNLEKINEKLKKENYEYKLEIKKLKDDSLKYLLDESEVK